MHRWVWFSLILFLLTACNPFGIETKGRATSEKQGSIPLQKTEQKSQIALTPVIVSQPTRPANNIIDVLSASSLQGSKALDLEEVNAFEWMANSDRIALVKNTQIVYYDLAPATVVNQIGVTNPSLFCVSNNQEVVAWVDDRNQVKVWRPGTKAPGETVIESATPVTGLALSPEGNDLALSTYDGLLKTWDVAGSQASGEWQIPSWVANLSYSPDSNQLGGVDIENFTTTIFDAHTGETQQELQWTETASPALYGAYFSPDWQTLAWVARGEVQIMDIQSGIYGPNLGHEDFVAALAWSPDSRLLATAAAATVNGKFAPVVVLWDVTGGRQLAILVQETAVQSLSFSPDGTTLAILDSNGQLWFWETIQ